MVAHHIKPKSEFPELMLLMDNGETLCTNCHHEHHIHDKYKLTANRRSNSVKWRREAQELRLRLEKYEGAPLKIKTEPIALFAKVAQLKAENLRLTSELLEYERAWDSMFSWDV